MEAMDQADFGPDTQTPDIQEMRAIFKALDNENKINVFQAVCSQEFELPNKEIARISGVSQARTSQILLRFIHLGLVEKKQQGKCSYYSANAVPLINAFKTFMPNTDEQCLEELVTQPSELEDDNF